jgi:hypothetical protein
MTLEDLAEMQAEAVQPIKYDFRHHDAGDGQGVSLWEVRVFICLLLTPSAPRTARVSRR